MAKIVLVEAKTKTEEPTVYSTFVSGLRELGHEVVEVMGASLEETMDLGPDMVVSAQGPFRTGKRDLLQSLFEKGVPVFTWGNDNNENTLPTLIAESERISEPAGDIAIYSHPITKGLTAIPNSGEDWRDGIVSTTQGTQTLAVDEKLEYFQLLYREVEERKWLHYHPSPAPPKKLMRNAVEVMVPKFWETPVGMASIGLAVAVGTGFVGRWLDWW